jgi:isoquinoline 1-oxidoreductase alpha subunit
MAKLNVNGKVREFEAEPDTPLLWVLREQLKLTGTKFGCGIAQCGACTVHIDGVATRSCSRPVASVNAKEKIVTIEGLSPKGSHPVQKAWAQLDVPQCGFCQSGMIMAVTALLKAKPNPSDADIDAAVTNICRCGTYNRVRAAIRRRAAGRPKAELAIQHPKGHDAGARRPPISAAASGRHRAAGGGGEFSIPFALPGRCRPEVNAGCSSPTTAW